MPCSAEVVLACQALKTAGYRLAPSEWAGQEELRPLVTVVDYLRVNLGSFKESDLGGSAGRPTRGQNSAIAGGIHSWEDHRKARELGIRYFQGDFFMKPQLFRRREVAGTRRSSMRLLRTILEDPLDLAQIQMAAREQLASRAACY